MTRCGTQALNPPLPRNPFPLSLSLSPAARFARPQAQCTARAFRCGQKDRLPPAARRLQLSPEAQAAAGGPAGALHLPCLAATCKLQWGAVWRGDGNGGAGPLAPGAPRSARSTSISERSSVARSPGRLGTELTLTFDHIGHSRSAPASALTVSPKEQGEHHPNQLFRWVRPHLVVSP